MSQPVQPVLGARRHSRGVLLVLVGLVIALLAACNTSEEQQIIDKSNATRRGVGITKAWVVDEQMNTKAKDWAKVIAARHALSHSNLSSGMPAGYRTLGENVGRGTSIQAIYNDWLRSSTHYANIINRAYTRTGVGVVKGSDGMYYAVQEFWG